MISYTKWIKLSNVTTLLMMIFLFVSILYIGKHSKELKKSKQLEVSYMKKQAKKKL